MGLSRRNFDQALKETLFASHEGLLHLLGLHNAVWQGELNSEKDAGWAMWPIPHHCLCDSAQR